MFTSAPNQIKSAEIVLSCDRLGDTLAFFREKLGFRLDTIIPADDPVQAVISGHGVRLRLDRNSESAPTTLCLHSDDAELIAQGALVAPNGTKIEFLPANPPLEIPPVKQEVIISRMGDDQQWVTGRAGMNYRDLIPGRLGGHVIASHIAIPDGGPVPDNVHFHKVHFQIIYCIKGWVKVLYEDNGPLITMNAGDCFMQPPEIRHRVVEASDGLEVIEVSVPSEHMTYLDHDMELPNPELRPEREYSGQKFVNHKAMDATWGPWRLEGFEARDLGINVATKGIADVKVTRMAGDAGSIASSHDCPMLFDFVQKGKMTLEVKDEVAVDLVAGDAFVIPPNVQYAISNCSADLEIFEAALPGDFATRT